MTLRFKDEPYPLSKDEEKRQDKKFLAQREPMIENNGNPHYRDEHQLSNNFHDLTPQLYDNDMDKRFKDCARETKYKLLETMSKEEYDAKVQEKLKMFDDLMNRKD